MFVRKAFHSFTDKQKRGRLPKGLIAVFMALGIAVFGCGQVYAHAVSATESAPIPAPTELSAQSAILIEVETGTVILQKEADLRLPMASTTKIMTALVALDKMPIDTMIEVSPLAVGVEGSSVYLFAGEQLTLEELLYAMLLESANDAATAIAIAVGGSVDGFAELMNQKAAEMGLVNTHFQNPHGLDDTEHYTTARELALIAAEMLRDPALANIISTRQKTIPHSENDGIRLLINHNKLLRSYDGCIGVKTGYTKKSGRCLVSAAERDGITLVAVTLNAPNDWKDHTLMLDYGFDAYESVTLCEPGDYQRPVWVESGTQSYVVVENRDGLRCPLPTKRGEVRVTVELPRFTYAPITSSQQIGQLVYHLYRDDGTKVTIGTVPLYAAYEVQSAYASRSLWARIKAFFHISQR